MDFDSIITFLFILAFFVLPLILKQVKARKKKAPQPKKVKKKTSIFGKLGEQIRQFVRELEEQAQKQRQAGKDQHTVWEELSEDEDADFSEPEGIVAALPLLSKDTPRPTFAPSLAPLLPFIKPPIAAVRAVVPAVFPAVLADSPPTSLVTIGFI